MPALEVRGVRPVGRWKALDDALVADGRPRFLAQVVEGNEALPFQDPSDFVKVTVVGIPGARS